MYQNPFRLGSAPDPAGGAYSALQIDPLAGTKGDLLLRKGKGCREGKGRRGGEGRGED